MVRLGHLPGVTQLISGGVRTWTQSARLQSFVLNLSAAQKAVLGAWEEETSREHILQIGTTEQPMEKFNFPVTSSI